MTRPKARRRSFQRARANRRRHRQRWPFDRLLKSLYEGPLIADLQLSSVLGRTWDTVPDGEPHGIAAPGEATPARRRLPSSEVAYFWSFADTEGRLGGYRETERSSSVRRVFAYRGGRVVEI